AFVRAIHRTLKIYQKESWIDWDNIPLTADWWEEICLGIKNSDIFVFVVSSNSLESHVCHLEIAHALKLGKRLVPIIREDINFEQILANLAKKQINDYVESLLDDQEFLAIAHDNWLELQRPNWTLLRKQDNFRTGITNLINVLELDIQFVREHTRLLSRADQWDKASRNNSYLLRGNDLTQAEEWLRQSGDKSPKPSELHTNYIILSRKAQSQRQRTIQSISFTGLVTLLVSTFLAIWQANIAQANAVEAERRAIESQSIAISSQARELWNRGSPLLALSLAVEANSIEDPLATLRGTLYEIAYSPGLRGQINVPNEIQEHVAYNNDENVVLSYSDNHHILWDVTTGELIHELPFLGEHAVLNLDATNIVGCCTNGLVFHDFTSTQEIQLDQNLSRIRGLSFDSQGESIYVVENDLTISQWDINNNELINRIDRNESCGSDEPIEFSPDMTTAVLTCNRLAILYDLQNETEIQQFSIPNPIADIKYNSNGNAVAIAWGLTVTIIDVDRAEVITNILPRSVPSSIAFMPDDKSLLINSDSIVVIWDIELNQIIRHLRVPQIWEEGIPRMGGQMIISDDSRQILFNEFRESRTWILDLQHGSVVFRLQTNFDNSSANFAFTQDGNEILIPPAITNGNPLCINLLENTTYECDDDTQTVEQEFSERGRCDGYEQSYFSSYSEYQLCAGSLDEGLIVGDEPILIDRTSGEIITRLPRGRYIDIPTFSPDNKLLVWGSVSSNNGDGLIRTDVVIYETATGNEILRLENFADEIKDIDFSPSGDLIAIHNCQRSLSSLYLRSCSSEIIILRIDTLPELFDWIVENRYLAELTCNERITYRVEPYCDEMDR
ncbi:MAG: toll/interleukin-1 receptor domain-containing protein, partial [Chloroflexota bacterium]